MAAPITFRNVPGAAAPNFGAELHAMQRAAQGPNLFDVFGEVGQDAVNFKQKQDTDAFVAKLNSFRDEDLGDGQGIVTADMQRQQFLQDQLAQKSFIDAGIATQAVTANRAQDFLKNAEGRSAAGDVRAEESHDDQLLTNQGIRNTRGITDKILGKESALLDLDIGKGQRAVGDEKLLRDELARKRSEEAAGRNFEGVENTLPATALEKIGALPEEVNQSSYPVLNKAWREERARLKAANPHASGTQLDAETNESFRNSGLDAAYAEAQRFHKLTSTQQKAELRSKKIDKILVGGRAGLPDDPTSPEYADLAIRIVRTINKASPSPEQQAQAHTLMQPVVDNYTPDFTGLPLISKTAKDMTRSAVNKFKIDATKRIRRKFPVGTISKEQELGLLRRGIGLAGDDFAVKLSRAENGFITQNKAAKIISDAKLKEKTFPIVNKVEAADKQNKVEAGITASGVFVQEIKDNIFKKFTENFPNREIDRADTDEFITRSVAILRERTDLTDGQIATKLRSALDNKAGVENISLWTNEAGFVDKNHTVEEADDIKNDIIFNILMRKRAVAEGSAITFPGKVGLSREQTQKNLQRDLLAVQTELGVAAAKNQVRLNEGATENTPLFEALSKRKADILRQLNELDGTR